MKVTQEQLEVLANTTFAQKQIFQQQNRDLIALLDVGSNELFGKMESDITLDEDADEAIFFLADETLVQEDAYARKVARQDLGTEIYKQFCLSFLRLKARHAIQVAVRLTSEAQVQL